jgi:LysM repeat protein
MRRSGQLRFPPQATRSRSRRAPWEEENVSESAYADEGDWQQAGKAWADDEEPSAYLDEHDVAEDASHYDEYNEDDPSFAARINQEGDDSAYHEAYAAEQDGQWDDEGEGDIPEERGLVALDGQQGGVGLMRRGGSGAEFGIEPYRLEPNMLAPVFIAGNGRKPPKPGALGHSPVALRAHRPRPFFFHTVALAIVVFSMIVSAFTVGALSSGPNSWNNFTSLAGSAAPAPPPVAFKWYTVRFGDTVEDIADRFGVQFGGILQLNGLIDGEQIYTGMNLKVPSDPKYGASFHALLHLPYAPAITPAPPYGTYVAPPGFYSFGVSDFAGDPYGGSFGQCTWWAAHKRPDEFFWGIGDAWTWRDGARARGYTVTDYPVPNATVVFQPGVQGALGVGHVAHLEQILSNGWILISEMNFFWNDGGYARVDYRYITAGPGVSFIH